MADTFAKKPYNIIASLDQHDGIFLMSTPPVPPILGGRAWHIGAAVENMSRFGLGLDRWNDDVKFDGDPVCSVLNSAWPILPHLNLFMPPFTPNNPNLLIPLLLIGSKSSNILSVGSVVAKKGPIAVTIPFVKFVGVNNACNDPLLMPTSVVVHFGSTVVLGFTLGDLVAAALQYGSQVVVDQILRLAGKRAGRAWRSFRPPNPNGLFSRLGLNILGRLNPGLAGNTPIPINGPLATLLGDAGKFMGTPGEIGASALVKTLLKGLGGGASWTYNNPVSSAIWGDYHQTMPDKVGDWIDGRSPPVLPPLAGPRPHP
ncbi:MAG: hypothetical protein U0414_41450 [Polyangiaceae bacterium]